MVVQIINLFFLLVAVGKAYSILSDPHSRNQYDMYGEEGLHISQGTSGQSDFSPDEVFRRFFGNNFTFSSEDGGRCATH